MAAAAERQQVVEMAAPLEASAQSLASERPPLATPPMPMTVQGTRPDSGSMPGPRPGLRPSGPNHAAPSHAAASHPGINQAGPGASPANGGEQHDDEGGDRSAGTGVPGSGATGPQLRRFIKSRAYVPMHELRRRFLINGGDDDVTPVDLGERRKIYVGLPEREGRLLGELLRQGDIGYELSLDPISPIVVGVYPMRPVTRA